MPRKSFRLEDDFSICSLQAFAKERLAHQLFEM